MIFPFPSTLTIAHRGAHGPGYPQNSLEAIRRAVRLGLAVELDAFRLADGMMVVTHDERVTVGDYWLGLRDLSWEYFERAGVRLWRLEPYLEELAETQLLLVFDWKSVGREQELGPLLSRYGLVDHVIVSSTSRRSLVEVKKTAPYLTTGRSISAGWARRQGAQADPHLYLKWLEECQADCLMLEHPAATAEAVELLHRSGKGIFLWTVGDPASFRGLLKLKVDGVCTDSAVLLGERRAWRMGHRGAADLAPRNTLQGIARAAELGADAVVLDVEVTKDGIAVVASDGDLGSGPARPPKIGRLSLPELKALDLGGGQRVPTLAEALQLARELDLGLYLELQSARAVRPTARLLREYDAARKTIVASFQIPWLVAFKRLTPHVPTSVIFNSTSTDPVELARQAGASYVHPAWRDQHPRPDELLTADWIERVRGAGLGIISWHEDRPEVIASLRRLGVDAICSGDPGRLLAH